jgi:hypothetical protein
MLFEPTGPVTLTQLTEPEVTCTGRIVKRVPVGLCVMTDRQLSTGAALKIDLGPSLLLGEVCHSAQFEGQHAVYVKIDQEFQKNGSQTPCGSQDAADAPEWLEESEAIGPASALLDLLTAVRRSAVRGDGTEYRNFQMALLKLEEHICSPGALAHIAASAAAMLQEYNARTNEYVINRISELESMVLALSQALAQRPMALQPSTPDLQLLDRCLAGPIEISRRRDRTTAGPSRVRSAGE